ncbi:hypothetical protein CBM2586_A10565 [Cupriavidus phytorum]|uniref:Uncharacterized protein n=1 Tax=Cupriavidus taiwanensis TaxID=164546 RepID=A0A375BAH6_9BURK|nr:hypothetical protein CBM2586_A10565 [Cupriavidus taiwanensis]
MGHSNAAGVRALCGTALRPRAGTLSSLARGDGGARLRQRLLQVGAVEVGLHAAQRAGGGAAVAVQEQHRRRHPDLVRAGPGARGGLAAVGIAQRRVGGHVELAHGDLAGGRLRAQVVAAHRVAVTAARHRHQHHQRLAAARGVGAVGGEVGGRRQVRRAGGGHAGHDSQQRARGQPVQAGARGGSSGEAGRRHGGCGEKEAARQALARRFRDNTGFRAPATAPARAVPSLCFRPVFHASRAAPAESCCRAPLVPDMLCRAAGAGPVRLFAAL